jgi:zinc protease
VTRPALLAAAPLVVVLALACGPRRTPAGGGAGEDPGAGPADAAPLLDAEPPVVIDWSAAGIDWSRPPAAGPEPAYAPPRPLRFALPSGARVMLVENRRLPLVSIRAVFTRAGAREDGGRAGLASLTADLLDEGAGALDALALPEALERLGAHLDTGVAEDAATVSLDTLAATLDDSLALLADVILRPRLTAADFARVQADTIEDLRRRPEEPRRVGALVFERLIFGDHPYGQPPAGFVATVEALTVEEVRAFWKRRYGPAHATIVVAGDVDRATLEPLLARHFGAWAGPRLPAARPPRRAAHPAPASLVVVDRPGAPQSLVMIGRRGHPAGHRDELAAEVIDTAIGGTFAARLNQRLREELGYTYGARSQFWRGEWDGAWSISTSLRRDVTVAGIEEALAIVEAARRHELPADELARTRQLLTRQLPQRFETNADLAGQLAALVVQRRPLDWYERLLAGVGAVSAARARAVAADAWADLAIVVIGDRAALAGDLARLARPIAVRDGEGNPLPAP